MSYCVLAVDVSLKQTCRWIPLELVQATQVYDFAANMIRPEGVPIGLVCGLVGCVYMMLKVVSKE